MTLAYAVLGKTDQNEIDNCEYSTVHDALFSGADSLKYQRDIFSAIARSLSILSGICAHRIDQMDLSLASSSSLPRSRTGAVRGMSAAARGPLCAFVVENHPEVGSRIVKDGSRAANPLKKRAGVPPSVFSPKLHSRKLESAAV